MNRTVSSSRRIAPFVLTLALLMTTAEAHKGWLAPSKTVLSRGQWITVDAGTATEPFVRDHNALRLDTLQITAPDCSAVAPESPSTGKLRASFDVQLVQPGSYRIAIVNEGLFATWTEHGQPKRWRGTPAQLQAEVPAGAEALKVTETLGRVETFATAGAPSDTRFKPMGRGLELLPLTSTADLVVGEPASFRFLIDGEPAANLDVEVIRDGTRYRSATGEQTYRTDAEGRVRIDWEAPGLHWIGASRSDDKASVKGASERRLSYAATVDVLNP